MPSEYSETDTPTLPSRPATRSERTCPRPGSAVDSPVSRAPTLCLHRAGPGDPHRRNPRRSRLVARRRALLDDHWHRLRLAENDWSFSALLEAATIQPDRFIDTWWQEKPVSWHYLRPFAILVAKSVYHLSDGSVKAWHAVSIVVHWLNTLLIYQLALWLTRRRLWSLVAGLLFVVYSHNVYAVAWLAARISSCKPSSCSPP